MKKFLSSLLIFWVLFSSVWSVFGQDSYSQYLPRVEKAIENMSEREVSNFQLKISDLISSTSNQDLEDFFKSVLLLTAKKEAIESVSEEIEETIKIVEDEITIANIYSDISESDQSTVNREIAKLQENLKKESISILSQIIASWNDLTRYTETWNMQANMDLEIENTMSLTAGMDVSEYVAQNQLFDSRITADIEWHYTADSKFLSQDAIDFRWVTNLEFIQKWQESYLIMHNTQFNTTDKSIELELTPIVEKLNELAADTTYLSFWDDSSFNPLEILEYFTQENLSLEIEQLFLRNLLEPYGKNENWYLLRPTIHFCDTGKKITNVFDPFNGKQCSEKQYQNMLDDFLESWVEITLQTWNDVRLSISNAGSLDSFETVDMLLIWKNASFSEFKMNVSDSYSNTEYMNIHYLANDFLSIEIPKQPYDPEFMLDIKLGRNAEIQSIDLLSRYEDEFIFTGKYKNWQLDTNLEISTPEIKASCNFAGDAYKHYLNVDGACEIFSPLIETQSQTLSLESTLMYNARNSENNLSWKTEAISDENNYFNFDIASKAKRTSTWNYEIVAPTQTISYINFLKEVTPENSYLHDNFEYDNSYDYEYTSYDDYDEACYIYDSGDSTCYQYYDNKDLTCEYKANTDKETCETFEYGYSVEETSFDEFDRVCYHYDNGDRTCYDYYENKDITCEYKIETDTQSCETYKYDDDSYNYYEE